MQSAVINNREDLDAVAGTPAHDAFISMLAGSLWRLAKDDDAQTWRAIEDNSTIERYGFSRADFSDATPPDLPAYVAPEDQYITVSPWQIRKALNQMGLRAAVESAVASGSQDIKDGWEFASKFVENDPFVVLLGNALGVTSAELHQIFELAKTL